MKNGKVIVEAMGNNTPKEIFDFLSIFAKEHGDIKLKYLYSDPEKWNMYAPVGYLWCGWLNYSHPNAAMVRNLDEVKSIVGEGLILESDFIEQKAKFSALFRLPFTDEFGLNGKGVDSVNFGNSPNATVQYRAPEGYVWTRTGKGWSKNFAVGDENKARYLLKGGLKAIPVKVPRTGLDPKYVKRMEIGWEKRSSMISKSREMMEKAQKLCKEANEMERAAWSTWMRSKMDMTASERFDFCLRQAKKVLGRKTEAQIPARDAMAMGILVPSVQAKLALQGITLKIPDSIKVTASCVSHWGNREEAVKVMRAVA